MNPSEQRFIVSESARKGPYTVAELKQLLADGFVAGDVITESATTGEQTRLRELVESNPTQDLTARQSSSSTLPLDVPKTFWLLENGVAVGPLTVEHIQAKRSANLISGRTEVYQVGTAGWLPLDSIPEFIPNLAKSSQNIVRTNHASIHRESRTFEFLSRLPSKRKLLGGSLTLGLVLFAAWLGYEWLRPLTVRETVERFNSANSFEEAKPYCTPRMLEVLRSSPYNSGTTKRSGERTDVLNERDAPDMIGGKFVDVEAIVFDQQLQLLVKLKGFLHVIQATTWLVNDLYVTSYNGESVDEPISVVNVFEANKKEEATQRLAAAEQTPKVNNPTKDPQSNPSPANTTSQQKSIGASPTHAQSSSPKNSPTRPPKHQTVLPSEQSKPSGGFVGIGYWLGRKYLGEAGGVLGALLGLGLFGLMYHAATSKK